ncbi:MAG TPA: adenylate/guanylate cyclase domain-containing protein, partial [Candidatus Eremiobacteraceae bacterium]|nr:adenylate/guanylate cyclase domain-containing protein [Candidatus Eremiobacteraceae bacterium]
MDPTSQRVEATATRVLPTGTVTFLFTDIEGSTQRWESKRDAMKAAVARHDALMRGAIEADGGYVFKTIGDAFCAAFRTAPEAIRAALAAQRALAKEDFSAVDELRVRAALHTGYADERDGDYFGPTVNRVARLLAIGHGGQVIVSSATSDLLEGELPPQTSLRDLGAHRLKDLAHPERVYQLVAADLPAEFAPLKSLDALPNNLPLQVTSFIGREGDVAEIRCLSEKSRLLTLVGPGGVGKTRLALQVGADLLERYPDGVWFVELATLTDPELVPSETALALNVRLASDRSLTDSIVHALGRKRALLILDNCEHLVDAVAKLARSLLQHCPNVSILTTSREGLGIGGEDVARVASLSLPAKNEALTAEAALHFGAIALFADRAPMANKSFRLSDDNVAIVVDICRRLDGIPFAIELAVARVKVLSIADLSKALHERFRVLTGGDRTALPRQKTMRALIDWSYDLLT